MDGQQSDTIPTTLRLLLVVEDIARSGSPVTPTEVNERLGLPKPTIHRLFGTLETEGFLQRDLDGRAYAPGPRLRVMAGGILSSLRIRTARLAILQKLSDEFGETCNIALPDRDAMIYLDRVETEWPLRIQLPIGSRVPFYCTASGKMYLSSLAPNHLESYLGAVDLHPKTANTTTDPSQLSGELEAIRTQGYALDHEEFMDGMVAIAVPICEANDRLMATLSIHAPVQRFDLDRAVSCLTSLQTAAVSLSRLVSDV